MKKTEKLSIQTQKNIDEIFIMSPLWSGELLLKKLRALVTHALAERDREWKTLLLKYAVAEDKETIFVKIKKSSLSPKEES